MRNDEVVKRPADPAELTKLYTDEAIGFIEKNKDRSVLSLPAAHHAPQPARRERRIQRQFELGRIRRRDPGTRSQRRSHLRCAETAGHR